MLAYPPFSADFVPFLMRAKQATYAASSNPDMATRAHRASSRPNSHDLGYTEGDWFYLDTYLGGLHFIGEEAVWQQNVSIWGMNYHGVMLQEAIPTDFGDFLKLVLRNMPADAPYRGPHHFTQGEFAYRCSWQGSLERFQGEESIDYQGMPLYALSFHGGVILS